MIWIRQGTSMIVKEKSDRFVWYNDYICTTADKDIIWKHFIKDFIFQHRVRYMVYFRISQNTKSRLIRFFVNTNYTASVENMGLR